MAKRTYELVLVIEAETDTEAQKAVDSARYAANGTKTGNQRRRVGTETPRERGADGSIISPPWPGWQTDADLSISISYCS